MSPRIAAANTADDLLLINVLFDEYWNELGFSPEFQDFEAERASLPGPYAPPDGRLALASVDGNAAGCGAFRRIDVRRCEAKRVYVRPGFRTLGIGGRLVEWLISEARTAGYKQMVMDTMPFMAQALTLYSRLGFERIEPYAARPTPGAIYLGKNLDSG